MKLTAAQVGQAAVMIDARIAELREGHEVVTLQRFGPIAIIEVDGLTLLLDPFHAVPLDLPPPPPRPTLVLVK